MPALATRMSTLAAGDDGVARHRLGLRGVATSTVSAWARPPAWPTRPAVSTAQSASRSAARMVARTARPSANSRPRPLPAPVTRATLPVRSTYLCHVVPPRHRNGVRLSWRVCGAPDARSDRGRSRGCRRGGTSATRARISSAFRQRDGIGRNWQMFLMSGLVDLVGTIGGARRAFDIELWRVARYRTFEPEYFLLDHLVDPARAAVDVGANEGLYAERMASLPRACTVSNRSHGWPRR